MTQRFLIISPNGFGNTGDDICAYGGMAAIRSLVPDAEIEITQPPMDKSLVRWADYIILSGGGIIYDRAPDNVANYMDYIDYAHSLGKKSAVVGVGYQGIVTPEGRKHYKESLAKAEFVSLRTAEDKELLDKDTGLKNTYTSFDVAFHVPELIDTIDQGWWKRTRHNALKKKLERSDKIKVGMSILDLKKMKKDKYGGSFKVFDDSLRKYLASRDKDVDVFLLQHAKEDGEQQKRLAKEYGCTFIPYHSMNDVPTLYSVYQGLDVMIGVRLHSIALSIMAGKPTVAIGSANAKQRRLSKFSLPTLSNQFIPLGDESAIQDFFDKLTDINYIKSLKPLSKKEYAFINKQKSVDLDLLKKMIG